MAQMLVRLSTTIEVELVAGSTLARAMDELRDAFREAGKHYPGLSKFLVRSSDEENEVEIGLLLDGVKAEYAEDMAEEIITYVIEIVERRGVNGDVAIERQDSSALAFA